VIVVTVGTQLPFDRLVRAVDDWCRLTGRTDVIGQVGAGSPDGYRPRHFEWSAFLSPQRLDQLVKDAELVVAHAGMGSIISALRHATPIVIMPRRAALGEHRNDHQVATAVRLADRKGVYVSTDETGLAATIELALANVGTSREALPDYADPALIDTIRRFIRHGRGATDVSNA
jgi:UDP-N-acetylglucosamine transferase subunit ALG13